MIARLRQLLDRLRHIVRPGAAAPPPDCVDAQIVFGFRIARNHGRRPEYRLVLRGVHGQVGPENRADLRRACREWLDSNPIERHRGAS